MKPDFAKWMARGWLGLILALLAGGVIATPYDPQAQDFLEQRLAPPSLEHPMGVDGLGRDYMSRVWRGGGHTLLMGVASAVGAFGLAAFLVLLEQTTPGIVQQAIRRTIGVWIAIPVLFIGLLLLVFLAPSPPTLVAAAAVGLVPLVFRQLRIFWLEQRQAEYVAASVVIGAGRWRLLAGSIWPNLRLDVWALLKLTFALAVLELSGLAFLGLIGDPDFPELGALLRENQRYLFSRPSLAVWPGLVLSLLLLSVHLTGTRGSQKT
jgi:peptide/nickel transport system permease protein